MGSYLALNISNLKQRNNFLHNVFWLRVFKLKTVVSNYDVIRMMVGMVTAVSSLKLITKVIDKHCSKNVQCKLKRGSWWREGSYLLLLRSSLLMEWRLPVVKQSPTLLSTDHNPLDFDKGQLTAQQLDWYLRRLDVYTFLSVALADSTNASIQCFA